MKTISLAQRFDDWASNYDRDTRRTQFVLPRRMSDAVAPHMVASLESPIRILDVGIGTGLLSQELREHYKNSEITGLDISPNMLNECRKKNAADLLVAANVERYAFPLPGQFYGLTVSNSVAELFQDPHNLVSEMVRVTRPGGIVAFSYMPAKGTKTHSYDDGHDMLSFCHARQNVEKLFAALNVEKINHTKRFIGYRIRGPYKYSIFIGRVSQTTLQPSA